MIIVHVAIVSECLLASNNPSTSAGIMGSSHEELGHEHRDLQRRATLASQGYGHDSPKWTWERFSHIVLGWSNTFETEFSPVSLLARGSNKMKCIRKFEVWRESDFQKTDGRNSIGMAPQKLCTSFGSRRSSSRQWWIEPLGMATSIHGPSITVSYDEGGMILDSRLSIISTRDAPDREPTSSTQEVQL